MRTPTVAALVAPSLDEAVAELGNPAIGADDFVPMRDYLDFVARVTGRRLTTSWYNWARDFGTVLALKARQLSALEQTRVWLYLPATIRGEVDSSVASEWLNGHRPDLTAWSPATMAQAVQRRRVRDARRATEQGPSPMAGAARPDLDMEGSNGAGLQANGSD